MTGIFLLKEIINFRTQKQEYAIFMIENTHITLVVIKVVLQFYSETF